MLPELKIEPRELNLAEGSLCVWTVRPGLVFTQARGRMVMAHAMEIMAGVNEAVRGDPGGAVGIHDWLGVEHYEVAVQARMSSWALTTVRSMRRIVIGVRSPLVALAVRTVNLAVGGRFEVVEDDGTLLSVARGELRPTRAMKAVRD